MAMAPEILNVDCLEYMRAQPDNAFSLAIVDPPYGIGDVLRNGNSRTKMAQASDYRLYDNTAAPPPEYFAELARVSRHQIIWGANHFCDKFNAAGSHWIVWDKAMNPPFAECEMAYSSFPGTARIFRYIWVGMHQGQFGGNKAKNEKRIHPSQKPVKLYQWLLSNYASPGDRILDTHLGSASSAIAAAMAGLEFVGCEIDPIYFEAAQARYQAEMAAFSAQRPLSFS